MTDSVIGFDDVLAAARRIRGVARRTPVVTSRRLDHFAGAQLFLKAEVFQRTGSFKFRGAYNAVASLTDDERVRGVVSHSSGNHAQALACAAQLAGTTAVIVMPDDAPGSKVAATEGYGARIVRYDRYRDDRDAVSAAIAAEDGRVLIPPYDHPAVMAGQGTVAVELLEDVPDLDALVVCVGGGGLLSGCATAAAALAPGIEIYGVEPEAGDDHRRSRQAGHRVDVGVPRTIADGQQTTAPGELTWPITNALTSEFVGVSDEAILDAMRRCFETLKVVVEPSGASALAAVLGGVLDLRGRRVGITLSGGNVDITRWASLLDGRSD